MTVSRRTLVKGGAWSVPAVAVATAAPALAASGSISLIGRIPSYGKRPQVVPPTAAGTCDTSVIWNTQITGWTDRSRQRYTFENNAVTKVPGTTAAATGGPMIRLVGDGVDENVKITNVKIKYGYWVAPIENYTGSFTPGTQEYTAIRDESKAWSTPTRTGETVTYSVAEFVGGNAAQGKPKKTTSTAPTPATSLTFDLYASSISNPATALARDTSGHSGVSDTPALYVDVPFQWSNQSTYKNSLSVVNAVNGSCNGVQVGRTLITGIALYQYAEFEVTYTKYGQSYTLYDKVVNGDHIH